MAKKVLPAFRVYAKRKANTPALGSYMAEIIPMIEQAAETPAKETIHEVLTRLSSIRYVIDNPV